VLAFWGTIVVGIAHHIVAFWGTIVVG